MQLELRPFRASDFPEYAAWFTDPELNRWLGPMDDEWLEAVLAEDASEGRAWAVFGEQMLVAVAETELHLENESLAAITGLAVKPSLRGQGFGGTVLEKILALNRRVGRFQHLAYIHKDNRAAQRCFKRVGFERESLEPSGEGYLEYRHTA